MYLPDVRSGERRTRRSLTAFGGLERTSAPAPGALSDSWGLRFDSFPFLASGGAWTPTGAMGEVTDLFTWDKLCTVEGTTFRYDGQAVGTVRPGRKQYAVVGTKLCIFPDKKYLDLTTREFGDLAAQMENRVGLEAVFTENSLSLEVDTDLGATDFFTRNIRAKMNATEHRTDSGIYHYLKTYQSVEWDPEARTWTKAGEQELWMIDSRVETLAGRYVILRQSDYAGGLTMNLKRVRETRTADGSASVDNVEEVLTDYGPDNTEGLYGRISNVEVVSRDYLYYGESYVRDVTITVEVHNADAGNRGFEGQFFPGDHVFIFGSQTPENNTLPDQPLTVEAVNGHTMTFVVPKGRERTFTPGVETGDVTVTRPVPDLDYICQGDNRLFGVNNQEGTVYASALGDPRNFYAYDGLATDSWRRQVGSAGDFTGCIAYSGSILFWKEDCLHKLLGARPSAYSLYTYHIDGLQAGSGGSMVILGDTLYYKGCHGVYAYTGSVPRLISGALGQVSYGSAAAMGLGEVYRVAMCRQDTGEWELLSYHTRHKVWLKEDSKDVAALARVEGRAYLLSHNTLYRLDDEAPSERWNATLVPFTEDTPEWKSLTRLLVEVELADGAWVEGELSMDGGPFQSVWSCHDAGAATAVIPLRPGRCHSWQLRFQGAGRCVIRGLTREFHLRKVAR